MEAVGSGIPGAWGQEGVGMSQKKQAQHETLPLTLPLLLPCPQLQPCPQASGFRILPMTPPNCPHPYYLPQERQLSQVLCTLALPDRLPSSRSPAASPLPLGGATGAGHGRAPPLLPHSLLLPGLPPPALPTAVHPTLATREIFQYIL